MLKVLVWQVSPDTSFKDKAIKILEQLHDGIEIVGEASNENIAKVDGGGHYDVLLCVGAKKAGGMSKVTANAHKLNLPEEKLLGDWIVTIPGFTLEKYRQLQRSHLSIIAVNCFGGMLAHSLGLSVNSPFFNLFVNPAQFMEFLHAPREYMKEPLVYHKDQFWEVANRNYPIAKLGNILMYMMHYQNFEEANEAWERRKTRINWDNLFVETHTVDKKLLEQFDALPYDKKVCFVPFKSELNSAWYVDPEIDKTTDRFDFKLHHFAQGKFVYYDPFDMLLYGKKTPLIDRGHNETYLITNPFY